MTSGLEELQGYFLVDDVWGRGVSNASPEAPVDSLSSASRILNVFSPFKSAGFRLLVSKAGVIAFARSCASVGTSMQLAIPWKQLVSLRAGPTYGATYKVQSMLELDLRNMRSDQDKRNIPQSLDFAQGFDNFELVDNDGIEDTSLFTSFRYRRDLDDIQSTSLHSGCHAVLAQAIDKQDSLARM